MKTYLKVVISLYCTLLVACGSDMQASNLTNSFVQERSFPNAAQSASPQANRESQTTSSSKKQSSESNNRYNKLIEGNKEACNGELEAVRLKSVASSEPNANEQAINDYNQVIQQGCDTSSSRLSLGLALAKAKRWNEAAEQYRIVVNRDPKNWAAHWTLAQTLILELGQYEEGLKEAQISRQLDDLDDIGFTYDYYIGKALDGLGRYDEALTHYQTYIKAQSKVWKNDPRLIEAKERVSVIKIK